MSPMELLRKKPVTIAYWLLAFVVSVFAGVGGAVLGRDHAPEFDTEDEGAAATSGARLLFGTLGFLLAGLATLALFAGIWLLLWHRQRRQEPPAVDEDEADGNLSDLLVDEDGGFIDEVAEAPETTEATERPA